MARQANAASWFRGLNYELRFPYFTYVSPAFPLLFPYFSLLKKGLKSFVSPTFPLLFLCSSPPPIPPCEDSPPLGARGSPMKRVKREKIEAYLRGFGFDASVALRKKQKRKLGPSQDFADLSAEELRGALRGISSLEELEGLANRKRHLSADHLRGWSADQVKIIMERKVELTARAEIERGDVIL